MSTASLPPPITKQHIFISYSHRDRLFVDKLEARLQREGVEVWLDRNEIRAGDSIQGRVDSAIQNACFVLVVLSRHSVNSAFVQDELRSAMAKQRNDRRRFVIPVLRDKKCEIPVFLLDRLRIDFSPTRRFERAFGELARSLEVRPSGSRHEVTAFPERDFVSHLEHAVPDLGALLRKTPLTEYYLSAVRTSAAGPEYLSRLLLVLSIISNSDIAGGVNNTNFMSHLGFLRDLRESSWISADLAECLRRVLIDRSISYPYRRITLQAVLELCSSGKLDAEHLLGSLWREFGFDPLLDGLVAEEFSSAMTGSGKLAQAWPICNPRTRRRIVDYCLRTSRWYSKPRLAEYCHEGSSFAPVLAELRSHWHGLLEISATPERVDLEAIDTALSDPTLGAGKAVECVERAFRTAKPVAGADVADELGDRLELIAPLSERELQQLTEKHGTAGRFNLLAGLIASPYVDGLASSLFLLDIRRDNQLSNLANHVAFPQCLFLPKPTGLEDPERFSLMDVLVSVAANGLENTVEYGLVVQLALSFQGTEFREGLYGSLRRSGVLKDPELRVLRRYAEDKVTGRTLIKDLNKRVAAWLSQEAG